MLFVCEHNTRVTCGVRTLYIWFSLLRCSCLCFSHHILWVCVFLMVYLLQRIVSLKLYFFSVASKQSCSRVLGVKCFLVFAFIVVIIRRIVFETRFRVFRRGQWPYHRHGVVAVNRNGHCWGDCWHPSCRRAFRSSAAASAFGQFVVFYVVSCSIGIALLWMIGVWLYYYIVSV